MKYRFDNGKILLKSSRASCNNRGDEQILMQREAKVRTRFILYLRGQYYDQTDGVARGSRLGPVLANIFMRDFEVKWVMKNINGPTIWFRYVDDTFTLFKNKNDALSFLHYLKKTFTGLYTKWDSFTRRKYKINLQQSALWLYTAALEFVRHPDCYSLP